MPALMKHWRHAWTISLFLLLCAGARTQPVDQVALESLLHSSGFPDATCYLSGDTLMITYDRSRYRPSAPATGKLLDQLDSIGLIPGTHLVVWWTDRHVQTAGFDIPLKEGQVDRGSLVWSMAPGPWRDRDFRRRSGRFSNWTAEFRLDPQLRFSFGSQEDPVRMQANILPTLDCRLWSGAMVTLQYVIPVWNELDIPEEKHPRPSLITLSQNFRWGRSAYGRLTVGYFRSWRYGGRLEVGRYLFNDRLFMGGRIGLTGYASWPRRLSLPKPEPGWQVSDPEAVDWLLTAGWRFHRQDVQILASAGQTLASKTLLRAQVARQFRQTTVELFVESLESDMNFGARVRIPIPFIRWFPQRRLAFCTGQFLDYRYNGTQVYPEAYDTGQQYPFMMDNVHPELILR